MFYKLGYLIGRLLRPLRLLLPSKIRKQLDIRLERYLDWQDKQKPKLSPLAEQQLEYLVKRFNEWHKKYYPRLTREKALEIYPGIPTEELLREVRNGKR